MNETASPIGVEGLRQHYAEPGELARKKIMQRLDPHATRFIALSPFLTIASMSAAGADCSLRGDAPGFVQVVDDVTLRIPDRRGNNLLDTMQNILAQPDVGLLFFVPGVNEHFASMERHASLRNPRCLRRSRSKTCSRLRHWK